MSYTAPPTFVSGDVLLASELNTLSDDIAYLAGGVDAASFSAVQVSRTTNQSIANNTPEYISFGSENFDYGGWWSSGTTVTTPAGAIPSGYTTIGVMVFASVTFAADSSGKRKIEVHKNGSSFGSWTVSGLDGGDTTSIYLPEVITVASGDTIKLQVNQTSGGSLNVTAARLTIVRVGAAS